jgi:hypothetical protein
MREVRLEPDFVGDACTTTPFSVELLVKAVRPKFSDLPCLTDNTSGSCSINPVIIVAGSRQLRSVFLRKMFSLFAQKMALSLTDIELLEEEQAPIALALQIRILHKWGCLFSANALKLSSTEKKIIL